MTEMNERDKKLARNLLRFIADHKRARAEEVANAVGRLEKILQPYGFTFEKLIENPEMLLDKNDSSYGDNYRIHQLESEAAENRRTIGRLESEITIKDIKLAGIISELEKVKENLRNYMEMYDLHIKEIEFLRPENEKLKSKVDEQEKRLNQTFVNRVTEGIKKTFTKKHLGYCAAFALAAGVTNCTYSWFIAPDKNVAAVNHFMPQAREEVIRLLKAQNVSIPQNKFADCLVSQAAQGYADAAIGNRYESYEPNKRKKLYVSDIDEDQLTFSQSVSEASFRKCETLNRENSEATKIPALREGLQNLFLKADFTGKEEFSYQLTYINNNHRRKVHIDTIQARLNSINFGSSPPNDSVIGKVISSAILLSDANGEVSDHNLDNYYNSYTLNQEICDRPETCDDAEMVRNAFKSEFAP